MDEMDDGRKGLYCGSIMPSPRHGLGPPNLLSNTITNFTTH